MDNLAIHFLNGDEQLVTQEAVNKLIFNIRNNQISNAWLALDEYGEEDFLSVDIANRWVALAFNTWDENGIAHMYQPINPKYEDSQEDAPVNIGSQTPVLKRNAIDNLDLAAECVLHFAKTGELYPNLKWEEAE
ncbi:hypothetical protein C0033_07190 [Clostridium sp. chh4-2]|uniref:hypothetical protein n=1 Tax=Clostridium sp. chh4-2 TaxID=2067550 RepID=UPI000CCE6005|nr:hypothetical protein [Clostridium sp. chh4-2]PNV62800.1 hypothetical protein C0033_07190 [Clostridium sp. chh4-2]